MDARLSTGLSARLAAAWSRFFVDSPLRRPVFRLFYFGSIGTALGYTMQTTVAAWVMVTLTPSEFMVALVQTASTGPTLVFGLISGALADIVDRRRLIMATQYLLLIATAILGVATLTDHVGPATLLMMTFAVGAGLTFYLPASSASINDLVSRDELPRAVALGAVAFNVARALGPALAGGLAAWIGTGSALLTSSVCFVLMLVASRRLGSHQRAVPGVPESVWSGVQSGLRFARHSLPMRSLMIRNVSFCVCASAFWALLPLIARHQLHLGAGGYGLLSAGFGVGAILGALSIPGQLARTSLNAVVTSGTVLWLIAIVLLALSDYVALAVVAACCGGAAWVSVLASLSAGTQSIAPAWVRARALSVNLVATQAGLALGSAFWGALAGGVGIRIALASSVGAMLIMLIASRKVRVAMGAEADVTPGGQLPDLTIPIEPHHTDGPVLIEIEYRVAVEHRAEFLRVIYEVEPVRRRNGASSWRVYRDLEEHGHFVERFLVESWGEYVRSRGRATVADRNVQDRISQLQRPEIPIRVARLIGVQRGGHHDAAPAAAIVPVVPAETREKNVAAETAVPTEATVPKSPVTPADATEIK